MSYTTKNFAIRKIKNGRVRVGGHTYISRNMEGVERFEGLKMVFGRYWAGDECQPLLNLWGEPSFFRCKTDEEIQAHDWPGIDCDDDGYFSWSWWDRLTPDYVSPPPPPKHLVQRDGNSWLKSMGIG